MMIMGGISHAPLSILKMNNNPTRTQRVGFVGIGSRCSMITIHNPTQDQNNNFKMHVPVCVPAINPDQPLVLPETRFRLLKPEPEPAFDGSFSGSSRNALGGRWLARMVPFKSNKWLLLDPLYRTCYFQEPPVVGSINMDSCSILELSRTFVLYVHEPEKNVERVSKKVVGGWNLDSSYHFCLLAQFEWDKAGGGLWFWKLGDEKWTEIKGTSCLDEANKVYQIVDIGYYNRKFYAFDYSSWQIGVIDPENGSVSMEFIAAPEISDGLVGTKHSAYLNNQSYLLDGVFLVPSDTGLYLVIEAIPRNNIITEDRVDPKSTLFVFLMKQPRDEDKDEEERQGIVWEQVNKIGDQIFFIGYDTCFTLPSSSANLPQWKQGSICLFSPNPNLMLASEWFSDHNHKIFDGLQCQTMLGYSAYWRSYRLFEIGGEENNVMYFNKLPQDVYTRLFFPPPPWVKWCYPDHDNAEVSLEN